MELDRIEIRRMMIAVNEICGAYALISKKIGIKENTLTLLYALDDGTPHSQKEICEEWFLPKTTLNTIVKECVEAGFLVLNEAGKSREKEICLTPRGRDYAAQVLAQVYALENKVAAESGLTPEAVKNLTFFAQNLKEETKKYTYGA